MGGGAGGSLEGVLQLRLDLVEGEVDEHVEGRHEVARLAPVVCRQLRVVLRLRGPGRPGPSKSGQNMGQNLFGGPPARRGPAAALCGPAAARLRGPARPRCIRISQNTGQGGLKLGRNGVDGSTT
jgi:hypothetical protein